MCRPHQWEQDQLEEQKTNKLVSTLWVINQYYIIVGKMFIFNMRYGHIMHTCHSVYLISQMNPDDSFMFQCLQLMKYSSSTECTNPEV